MKNPYLLLFLVLFSTAFPFAQTNPAAREDAAAEKEKLLRAADQIDLLQVQMEGLKASNELNKTEIEKLKTDLAASRTDNTALKNDLLTVKNAVEKLDASRAEERATLLKEISKIVAESSKSKPLSSDTEPTKSSPSTQGPSIPPAISGEGQKGFTYTVQKGDTLWAVVEAYRTQGVKVTLDEIRKSNSLKKGQPLQAGQKLFIPKKE